MATLGNFALMFGLAMAIFGTIASLLAALLAREPLRKAAIRAYLLAGLSTLTAVVSLAVLLHQDDFSNVYVYGHSNKALHDVFKVTAVWAGSQGSLLWWTMILMVYTAVFLLLTRKAPRLMTSWAMAFIGTNLIFFLLINNIVSNPFAAWHQVGNNGLETLFFPGDGRGLNPQLQHWAMIIHPPLLYTGYIGFLFPFALTMGALASKLEGREWLPMVRRWTLAAWLILGVGIVLGGGWAYMELGWGGYWAWDPVENASFMPWLLATAFLHSIMAQERRGMFKLWNVILLIASYLMCLFGTFITRSGLISSVHAFAASTIGNYYIGLMAVLITASIAVLVLRRDQLVDDNSFVKVESREMGLLFNNVLFVAICGLILFGVVFPLITEYFGDKRELRHAYFNVVVLPFFLLMMVVMGIGPVLTWKQTSKQTMIRRFRWPVIIAIPTGLGIGIFAYSIGAGQFPGFSAAAMTFLLVTIVQEFWEVVRLRAKRAAESFVIAFVSVIRLNKRRYGGYFAHFGVLLVALGITGASFNHQAKKELGIGESMEISGFTFQVEDIKMSRNANFESMTATINLIKDGKVKESFHPEQRFYLASESQASEVSISTSLLRDYYVVLAGPGEGYTNEHPIGNFHIYVNPLVAWVWIGTLFLVMGTFICFVPDKQRVAANASAFEGMGVQA